MEISEEKRLALQKEKETLNKWFRKFVESDPTLRTLFTTRVPNYRYYPDKKKNRYFYTTEVVTHKGKKRYVSGVYKYQSAAKQFKLAGEKYHAKKRDAIKRALELWNKATKNADSKEM